MEESLFDKYKRELEEELVIDDFRLKDLQSKLPAIKHKWVARLIEQKIEKKKLCDLRDKGINDLSEDIRESQPVQVSDKTVQQLASRNEVIQKIDKRIHDCEILIEYLEKVETVCRSITYDIKNIIEIKKLELT